MTIEGKEVGIFDPMGKDTILFHRTTSDDETSDAPQYVEQARTWFDSMWSIIAREYQP